jgi:radical SAM protein with 4Fe4S-binding SPASM domain
MLVEVFQASVVNEFGGSWDGDGTKEDYERLSPPGRYEKLIEFLIKVKELRDRYSPGTTLVTSTIVETQEGQKRWMDLLVPLGWTPLFRPWYTLPQSMKTQIEQPRIALKKGCQQFRKKYLYFDFDGTVVPCCVYPRPFELGNLKDQKFSEILLIKQRKLMLQELNTNKKNMAVCGEFPY